MMIFIRASHIRSDGGEPYRIVCRRSIRVGAGKTHNQGIYILIKQFQQLRLKNWDGFARCPKFIPMLCHSRFPTRVDE